MADSPPIEIRVQAEALDDPEFPLGVIRIDRDKSVTYLNHRIATILGDTLHLGMQITDLPLEADSRRALEESIAQRFDHQRGSGYALVAHRRDIGTIVRGRVAAVPEYWPNGDLRGSIGFIVDESVELAAMAMYKQMDLASHPATLLAGVAASLRELLPYDSFMVTAIAQDEKHLRSLFETPAPPPAPSPYRWWPMPEFVRLMLKDLVPGPQHLDALYADPEFDRITRTDPLASQFRQRDFGPMLRLSVRRRDSQAAIVTLLRRSGQPAFTQADLRLCQRLPLVQAVASSMALEDEIQDRFALDLIGDLIRAGDRAQAVAQRLVDQLWGHFKWEHVSLFRVVEDRARVRLVCQATQDASLRLPDDFDQPLSLGLLGRCARERAAVNVGDVAADPDYVVGVKKIRSELVMPLPVTQTRWLLNIESSQLNAFADEEKHAIERLLRVTAFALERTAVLESYDAIMDNIVDAVIQTNESNVIRDVNLACIRLLGHAREQMVGRDLASFLEVPTAPGDAAADVDAEVPQPWGEAPPGVATLDSRASNLIQSDMRTSEVLRFARADGSSLAMLVSTATIPGEFGGKVFIASDLSGKQYLDRVERLMPVFRQLASEIRVPLALAANFLELADEDQLPAAALDAIQKAGLQIRKADVSVERVMRAAGAVDETTLVRTTFALARVAQHVERNLPSETCRILQLSSTLRETVHVQAAFPELVFCVESLLAHLLQARSPGQMIRLESGLASATLASLTIGLEADPAAEPAAEEASPSRSAAQAVIEAVVPSLMARMGGRCTMGGGAAAFVLTVPLAVAS